MTEPLKEVYKEEAYELLAWLETSLLALEEAPQDKETIGCVFRALHTIKGSGAMFGFDRIAAFTHEVETAFDLVRNQKLAVTKNLVDLTLKAADLIRSMLDASDSADMAEIGKLSTSSVAVAEQAGQMLLRIVPDIQKTANLVQGDHSCIQ